jgi:Ca2+-binding RTX toxin-like protein
MDDTVLGGPGNDTILGGSGGDFLDGRDGDDTIDSGLGDPLAESFDVSVGGNGFNTMTYSLDPERAALPPPAPVQMDKRDDVAFDADGSGETILNVNKLVGTPYDDEIIGGHQAEVLVGRGGADVLCGGLGVDAVDYSGSAAGVNVTLDGTQPTDPDLAIQLVADPGGPSTEELRLRYLRARHDCRQTVPTTGKPAPGGWRDCTPDDGVPGENDCVGEDVENIVGSEFDDVLVGNDVDPLEGRGPRVEPMGANLIQGGGGNDVMDGRGGPDVYEGGPGVDTLTYAGITAGGRSFAGRGAPVTATIDGVANDGGALDRNRALLTDSINTDVEQIIGTVASDTLRGSAGGETLLGGDGDDLVDGGGGADRVEGNTGNDAVLGGAGNDTVLGGTGNDEVDGEAGDDNVQGENGSDLVIGGDGADTLSGGNDVGEDTLDYTDATTRLHVTADGVNDDGRAGEGDNVLTDFEVILGGSDDDVLVGGPGSEFIAGNDGNDTVAGGAGADDLSGGPGIDAAMYGVRTAPVFVNLAEPGNDGETDENDYVLEDVEKVVGGSGDDTLLGDAKVNVLAGGPGNDRVAGAEGDDELAGEEGNDNLSGDVGNDTLFGGDGNDTLFGAAGNDDLKGEAGDDNLDAGAGTDRNYGGPGLDGVVYASRSAAVTVLLKGKDGNGEKNENDFVNHDVESVATGAGGDTIDADDNLAGRVKCGGGADDVTADPDDRVDADCENVRVSALGTRCIASSGKVKLRGGKVPVRLFCAVTAKGKLTLKSAVRVKIGKKRKTLSLGAKSFSLKAGQRKTISVKVSKRAARMIKRKKRLSVRATINAKPQGKAKALKTKSVFTVRAG